MIPKYRVRCVGGGEIVEDLSTLSCPHRHNSLLRAEYCSRRLHLAPYEGMYRYLSWLPVTSPLLPAGGPVSFDGGPLARELGLSHLQVSFSGYYPERGAHLTSGSFKELEASPTMQRQTELGGKILVIASAGNTGRAFAEISARCTRPVVIVVPEQAVSRLWTTTPAENVFLVAVRGDYTDAISVSNTLAAVPGCVPEGGAKNIARRDGMGTVMLDAAVTVGRIPDQYFQAVGSGTGAIAAWEAALRLIGDGRYGTRLPRLHLAQNEPFTPMVSAWQEHRREIVPEKDMPDAAERVKGVMADVLTNRTPPYGILGGLFDALTATDGTMYSVSNAAGADAMQLVQDTLDIDLDPAAAVATAALVQAIEKHMVKPDDHILLNLTGGGYERIREDFTLNPLAPAITIGSDEPRDALVGHLREWIVHHGRTPDHR
ncbi:cysteate synthase [Methanoregula sp.]|uniref:cysteate synthase n=1 Tax=Methanoregula sp. TaxID=2052170 RepID=UPI002623BBBB|nr:cysteate synthase [Methanoregula sp.]